MFWKTFKLLVVPQRVTITTTGTKIMSQEALHQAVKEKQQIEDAKFAIRALLLINSCIGLLSLIVEIITLFLA